MRGREETRGREFLKDTEGYRHRLGKVIKSDLLFVPSNLQLWGQSNGSEHMYIFHVYLCVFLVVCAAFVCLVQVNALCV